MNEVSIIINGERYDAVEIASSQRDECCELCEITEEHCAVLTKCPLSSTTIFRKSTKTFEP